MDPYVLTFHLGLGIGVIGPVFYISLVIWDPIHLFGLLLNREMGLIVSIFLIDWISIYKGIVRIIQIEAIGCPTRAYITRPINRNTPPLSYIPYITLDRYHIHGI